MKKAQSATEFVILVSFMLIMFFVFLIIIQNRIVDITKQQDLLYLQEANNIVISEVQLAFDAAPDFEHVFTINEVNGKSFYINVTDSREVTSSYGGDEYVNFFPHDVTGHLNALTVNNTIYSLDGKVDLPAGGTYTDSTFTGIFLNVNPELCYIADTTADCSYIPVEMVTLCQDYFTLALFC